jgi:hypothetical protein
MKKVLITIAAVLTLMSCSKEEMTETQEVETIAMPIFVGNYENNETSVNGILSNTCDKIWSFASTSVNITNCDGGSWTSGYTFDDTTLFIAQYTDTEIVLIEYTYIEDANGDLTLTLLTGEFEVIYKLTR